MTHGDVTSPDVKMCAFSNLLSVIPTGLPHNLYIP